MAEDFQALVIDIVSPLLEPGTDLTSTTPLSKQLDSMAMVHIILALEGRLGCSFGPTDIQFDHICRPEPHLCKLCEPGFRLALCRR